MERSLKRPTNELADQGLKITPLGAGNEVGRSCVILEYKGIRIMLDCGIHPAHKGIAALPYFDEIDPASIDMILVTHFHLDHSAALPYFLAKTDFKGRVFMTHPTKSIYQLLLQDYIRVSAIASPDPLFDEIDLNNSMDRIEAINFHQVVSAKGARFWAYHAGHVLGAAMFMIDIAGVKVLYTGDYSRKEDRHLAGAEVPETKPDVLIIESTYGIQRLEPVEVREKKFTDLVRGILLRGGRCLIPVFALGRAQELLLILDEFWEAHPELHSFPVYYASSLARKCISVYQTYINMMNSRVQKEFETRNPFDFRHIRFLRGPEDFHDVGPCVVFASPGMLQSGFSRKLFESWCGDERNGVIIPGYIVDGTLAKTIMLEPAEIESQEGGSLPLKMSVDYVTFSAHADFKETSSFIDTLEPPHIILVHGDNNEMSRLENALNIRLKGKKTQISSPKNCQTVELEFGTEKVAKTVGKLAAKKPHEGDEMEGVLALKDYNMSIMLKEELANFTPLVCASIFQSIKIPFSYPHNCLAFLVSETFHFSPITEERKSDFKQILVSHVVKLLQNERQGFVIAEWMSSPSADTVADAVIALLTNAESMDSHSVAKLTEKAKNFENDPEKRAENDAALFLKNTLNALKTCFGEKNVAEVDRDGRAAEVRICGDSIGIDRNLAVVGECGAGGEMVARILRNCAAAYRKVDFELDDEVKVENRPFQLQKICQNRCETTR